MELGGVARVERPGSLLPAAAPIPARQAMELVRGGEGLRTSETASCIFHGLPRHADAAGGRRSGGRAVLAAAWF